MTKGVLKAHLNVQLYRSWDPDVQRVATGQGPDTPLPQNE